MLETYAWTAVLQLTYSAVAAGTGLALAPLLGLALDGLPAFALAYGLLPYLAYRHVQQPGADDTARFKLLAFAAVEGLLVGFLLADRCLSTGGPLTFLTPLVCPPLSALLTHSPPAADDRRGRAADGGQARTESPGLHRRHRRLGPRAAPRAGPARRPALVRLPPAGGRLLGGRPRLAPALPQVPAGRPVGESTPVLRPLISRLQAPTHLYQLGYFLGALGAQAIVYALFGGSYEDQKAAAQSSQ